MIRQFFTSSKKFYKYSYFFHKYLSSSSCVNDIDDLNDEIINIQELSNEKIVHMLKNNQISLHSLEILLPDSIEGKKRCVEIRREMISEKRNKKELLDELGLENYDYGKVYRKNCENVIGYVEIPVGVIGPLNVNEKEYYVPIATTEGCLIASTQRGCKAINVNGVNSVIIDDGMTRGPIIEMKNVKDAKEFSEWVDNNFDLLKDVFDSTSNYAELVQITSTLVGKKVFLRFKATTGDAMGMNMLSKGTENVLLYLITQFDSKGLNVVSLSGNYCVDKKPSAMNWIKGRGKSVVAESTIPKQIFEDIFKIGVDEIVKLHIDKNYIGSAIAGATNGGFNAHASNIVSGIFIACGQDVAQNVESSNCITILEKTKENDLYISCSMPSIEVGTVGGGTGLPSQSSCLDMMGLKGSSDEYCIESKPSTLANVICATVMCGELSLLAELVKGGLVSSHLKMNR